MWSYLGDKAFVSDGMSIFVDLTSSLRTGSSANLWNFKYQIRMFLIGKTYETGIIFSKLYVSGIFATLLIVSDNTWATESMRAPESTFE